MNKKYTIVSGAVLLLAAIHGHADSNVTFYGKANLSLNQVQLESKTPEINEWQLNSNASRLGVKGFYDINDGLQAIFQMEFEVNIDDGDKGGQVFGQRNIYAGLKGGFGRVIAGKHDTPLKLAQGKIDRFNDLVLGDIKNYTEGEDRVSNIVMYTTPKMNGLSATIAVVPGEDSANEGDDGLADGSSISINYVNDWVTAAIAHNSDIDSQDTTRVAADFKFGKINVGVLVQDAEKTDGTADESSVIVSAQYKLASDWVLKAQYGATDYGNNKDDTQISIGADKKLGKQAKFFAYYADIKREVLGSSVNDSTIAVGYEIKF